MPLEAFSPDEASRACLRALARVLAGGASHLVTPDLLLPSLELASAGAIFVIDSRHRVVHVNRRGVELAALPAPAVLGRKCRDVFRCVNCPAKCPLFAGTAITGREVVLHSSSGRHVPVLKNAQVLLDDEGTLVGGLEVMHDLTQFRRLAATGSREPTGWGAPVDIAEKGWRQTDDSESAYGIVGKCSSMNVLITQIERLARVDATVLVTGESGTGKELVARALHDAGPRSGRPFHAVNCAALSESLLESELFGHERGAFTGAVRDKVGRLEVCEDGTVLLDEIGCLPYALQSKLLRVLEDGGFERVGGTKPRRLRARVVAATNADVAELVRAGSFRADLFYRLNVCSLRVPPLRERRDDVPRLAEHFARKLAASCGSSAEGFSRAAMRALQDYSWPGNVRELRNVVHAALVSALDRQIGCEHLPQELANASVVEGPVDAARIEDALIRARYNRSEAAALLGVSRTTLWRYMRRAGLE